jgi:hypothetical protein
MMAVVRDKNEDDFYLELRALCQVANSLNRN